jgi:hypothetical protein
VAEAISHLSKAAAAAILPISIQPSENDSALWNRAIKRAEEEGHLCVLVKMLFIVT